MKESTNHIWTDKKVGDILELLYGKPLPKNKRLEKGLYPAYGANGEKTRTNDFLVDYPSIIVGRKGSAGEITLTENKFWPLDVTYYVKYDSKAYDLRFLYYLLVELELPKLAKGVKPGINRNDVYKLKVKVPDIQEQKRIVSFLDDIYFNTDLAIKNTVKNEKNATSIFNSYLNKLFSNPPKEWMINNLGNLFDFKNGRAFKKSDWKKTGLPIIRIQNLNNQNAPYNYFNGSYAKDIEINKGDLLFSWSGTVGSSFGPHIWKGNPGLLNQHIFKATIKKGLNTEYAYYYLLYITSEIEKKVNGAVGLVHITKEKLNKFSMAYPKLPEQEKISAKLTEILNDSENLSFNYNKKLSNIYGFRKSVLNKAFKGEL